MNNQMLNHAEKYHAQWNAVVDLSQLAVVRHYFISTTEMHQADAGQLVTLWNISTAIRLGANEAEITDSVGKEIIKLHSHMGRKSIICDETIEFFAELEKLNANCLPEFKRGKLVEWLKSLRAKV